MSLLATFLTDSKSASISAYLNKGSKTKRLSLVFTIYMSLSCPQVKCRDLVLVFRIQIRIRIRIQIRIRIRIHMFLGLPDPDPDPSIIKQK
jgi:hypothetical protein